MSDDYQPCAHCGGPHEIRFYPAGATWSPAAAIDCKTCRCGTGMRPDLAAARAVWNNRADDGLQAEYDRLQRVARRYIVNQRGWNDDDNDYHWSCRDCGAEGPGREDMPHNTWCVVNRPSRTEG